jgi:hypothetical protein
MNLLGYKGERERAVLRHLHVRLSSAENLHSPFRYMFARIIIANNSKQQKKNNRAQKKELHICRNAKQFIGL